MATATATNNDQRLTDAAPRMLQALQRLSHPAADDTDIAFALAVIAYASGTAQLCDCHGLEELCEDCGGMGYAPIGSEHG